MIHIIVVKSKLGGKIEGGKFLREGKRLIYFVAVFFFFSLFLVGGCLEEKEIKTLENVFILNWKENKIKLLLNGQEKVYICDEYAKKEKTGISADIIMRGKRVLQVQQENQVVEAFSVKKGERIEGRSVNMLAVNKKEEKILEIAKERWMMEKLFGYKFE